MIETPDSALAADLHPSPNIEPRRNGARPNMLLLHYTGMKSAAAAIDWLSRPESRVSCHYVIDEAGRITQMVAECKRAWHAGISCWAGDRDINSASIGIEIQNPGHEHGYHEFAEAQIEAVLALSRDIVLRNGIRAERVLAHSDVAPSRKIDPGEKFDWPRLARSGIGHWVRPAPLDPLDAGWGKGESASAVAAFQGRLGTYGYDVPRHGVLDDATACAVRAFQLHFRPGRVDGRIDRSSDDTLGRLLAELPQAPVSSVDESGKTSQRWL